MKASCDNAGADVLAWTEACAEEEGADADADEPPERPPHSSPPTTDFKRTPLPSRRGSEHESLLTKALHQSDDDEPEECHQFRPPRRRSVTSNLSIASTLELTCDTGVTTPARTSSPSPRLPDVGFIPIPSTAKKATCAATSPQRPSETGTRAEIHQRPKDPAVELLEKKRCIKFACAAKPKLDQTTPKASTQVVAAKRPTISFACHRPRNSSQDRQPQASTPVPPKSVAVEKRRSLSTIRSTRSLTPRRTSQSPTVVRKRKIVSANMRELRSECSRFHEFASDEPQDDDWILHDDPSSKARLTINDTLEKENAIRKLGKEAEEELEEEIANDDDCDNDEDVNEDEVDYTVESTTADVEDDFSGYGSDDDASDFGEEDDDDGLELWSVSAGTGVGATQVYRRPSFASDSCSSERAESVRVPRGRRARVAPTPGTPELPDSTDFVCGTLDEDRPLEEAYISRLCALKSKKEKYPIPQDIDPSFPLSDEEDNGGSSSDQQGLFGELDDLHHEVGRKRKSDDPSPRKFHSPPTRRLLSPPPKARGRSPKRLFDRQSPRRRSPPPAEASPSPPASSVLAGQAIAFKSLAFRPGLTQAKSLPKTPVMFPHIRRGRTRANTITKENHVRGAIDIVKGLEQKRARRKEKFLQKYCNRARKEKAQEKRPPPGRGAAHMREIGLLMAGKIGQGNYVLSV